MLKTSSSKGRLN